MLRRMFFLTLLTLGLAAPAQAAITVSSPSIVEGGKLAFVVTSTGPAVNVAVATSNGSAKANDDYFTKSDTYAFLGGDEKTFEVQTVAEDLPEVDETVIVTATAPGQDPVKGTGTIKNDDQPTLSVADLSVAENGGTAKVTVGSQPINAPVTVNFATADGSAGASDYEGRSGTLTIPAGAGSATIDVPIRNDGDDEDDESFKVTLSSPSGAKVGDGEGTVTITNDDVRLITVGDIGVVEGDGEQTVARLPVQLNGPTFRTVSVAFVTIDGPAKAPRDYLARFGSVVFQPGQTTQFIDIAIAADDVREPDEFFAVLIGQATGAKIGRDAAVAAIRDDDADNKSADSKAPRMKLTKPRLSGSRSIRARVTCPKGEQRCKGRLVLYTKIGSAERRIGSKTFSLPGNAARTLRITIPKSLLRAARRRGRLALRAYMVTSDAAENVDTTTKSATLRFKRS
jgi:hypothetical protein